MKIWDYVTLDKELKELGQKGIHKGYEGLVAKTFELKGVIYTDYIKKNVKVKMDGLFLKLYIDDVRVGKKFAGLG